MEKSTLNALSDDQLRQTRVMIDDILRERDEKQKADAKKQAAVILEAADRPLTPWARRARSPVGQSERKPKLKSLRGSVETRRGMAKMLSRGPVHAQQPER